MGGKQLQEDKRNVGSAAAIVMTALVVSRITGFIRQTLVPSIIGSNELGDAYDFAFKITDLMFYLLVGGSIAAALIPVLTGYIAKSKEKDGWTAVSTFMNTMFLAMLVLVILGIIFAPQIVPLLALGFSETQIKLIIDLTRILLPSVGIMMLAGMVNGVLNAYHRFSAAAYGPSLYNVLCAFSIIFLSRISIQAIAVGVLCSAMIYFLFQLAFALKNMKYYRMVIDYKHPGSGMMFRLAVPSLLSSSIAQVNVFITSMFTTLYPVGSVVALNIADRIWQTPYGIFAQGMGIALLPTLAEDYASDKLNEFKRILIKGLKTVMLLTVPSAAALAVLSKPLIEFFKFSAKFDAKSMATAQSILMFFTIALLAHSILTILIRAFYAANDTKTPLFTGIVEILINIGGAYLLYRYTDLGAGGMALSYSVAGVVNAALLFYLLNKKLNGLGLKKFFVFSLKAIISAVLMSAVIYLLNKILNIDAVLLNYETAAAGQIIKAKFFEILFLGINATVGIAVYFGAMILMKAEEASYIYDSFKNKIKRIFKRHHSI